MKPPAIYTPEIDQDILNAWPDYPTVDGFSAEQIRNRSFALRRDRGDPKKYKPSKKHAWSGGTTRKCRNKKLTPKAIEQSCEYYRRYLGDENGTK